MPKNSRNSRPTTKGGSSISSVAIAFAMLAIGMGIGGLVLGGVAISREPTINVDRSQVLPATEGFETAKCEAKGCFGSNCAFVPRQNYTVRQIANPKASEFFGGANIAYNGWEDLIVGPDRKIYLSVFNREEGRPNILRYSQDGTFEVFATCPNSNFTTLGGIAFDRFGNLFTACGRADGPLPNLGCALLKISPAGVVTEFYGSGRAIDLDLPNGIEVDNDGMVYVTDTPSMRILKINPETETAEIWCDDPLLDVPMGFPGRNGLVLDKKNPPVAGVRNENLYVSVSATGGVARISILPNGSMGSVTLIANFPQFVDNLSLSADERYLLAASMITLTPSFGPGHTVYMIDLQNNDTTTTLVNDATLGFMPGVTTGEGFGTDPCNSDRMYAVQFDLGFGQSGFYEINPVY